MSASSKKKLRNEQNAAKMTERQLQEQKEAKKLKLMSIGFSAVLALILAVSLVFGVKQFITTSGIREKNTVAATIGETELTNAQLNYYYVDAVNEFARTYGAYAAMFGLDLTKPLNEQVINEETGATWADDFVTSALENARATYALVDAAKAAGFELTEDEKASISNSISQMELSALMQGYTKGEDYIKAYYGRGASLDSFREYIEMNTLAQAYYSKYATDLTYDEAALKAAEEGKEAEFSNFSYNYYYLNTSKFLQGGTTAEDGTTTYSDEEKAKAKTAAEEILAAFEAGEKTEEAFAALATEKTTDPGSKENGGLYENVYPGQMVTAFNDWCFDAARATGDTAIVETEYGCHVMYFVGNSDMTYRDFMIESTLRNADLSAWESGLIEAAELEVLNTKYVRTDMVLNANQ